MSADEIRQLRQQTPFQPFTVCTVAGDRVFVRDPLNIGFSYDRKSILVALPKGGAARFDLKVVTHTVTGN